MAWSGTTVETPERNSMGHAMRYEPGRLLDVTPEPELGGKDVGSARGKYAQRDRRVDHSIHDLVDSAIATGDENARCPLRDGGAGDLAGGPGRRCGRQGNNIPGPLEQVGRALHLLVNFSAKAPRNRVIN